MRQSLVGLELPIDLVEDAPRVTLYGHRRAIVENHRGIIEYGDAVVRLAVCEGSVEVSGMRLIISDYDEGTAVVDGVIRAVRVLEKDQ